MPLWKPCLMFMIFLNILVSLQYVSNTATFCIWMVAMIGTLFPTLFTVLRYFELKDCND